jgi:hypothetical protein
MTVKSLGNFKNYDTNLQIKLAEMKNIWFTFIISICLKFNNIGK